MKEISIEEKAKAYDKVVNKLKGFIMQGVDPLITMADVQDFFPELKESEDERIRKAIINMFKGYNIQKVGDFTDKEIIAWLENMAKSPQLGEQKPAWSEEDESILQGIWDEILANKHNAKKYEWKTYDKFLDWLKALKERIGG